MQTSELSQTHPTFEEVTDDRISLGHVVRVLRRYRTAIVVSLLSLGLAYALLAVALYLFGPSQEITTLPFRLMFEGADAGRYPNGMEFNSSEITATPVLEKVYRDSDLRRFIPFTVLKSSIFVVEHNKDLERLDLEYNSKLADPKLSPVDRERLEKEYDLKKDSIRRTDYALSFVVNDSTQVVPRDMRTHILSSVLNTWAEQAMNEKGAGRYRIPVLSRNIIRPEDAFEGQDYVVTIDILRTVANRIITSIDQLLTIPGAEVLATAKDHITLPETRVNLEDTRRFRLEPLMANIRDHHLSKNYSASVEFLEAQLDSARRRRDQERARVATLQHSLDLYMSRSAPPTVAEASSGRAAAPANQVTPFVDKTFLDQIADLVAQKRDVDYRQRIVDSLNNIAITQLLPAENETTYYENLVQSMKAGGSGGPATPEQQAQIKNQYDRAAREIYAAVDHVSEIYRLMSRNLNPGLVVYTPTGAVEQTFARSFSLRRLLAFGVLLMLLAIPVVLFAALLHNRVQEERAVEEEHITRALAVPK